MLILQSIMYVIAVAMAVLMIMTAGYGMALAVNRDDSLKSFSYRAFSGTARNLIKCLSGSVVTFILLMACTKVFRSVIWEKLNRVIEHYDASTDRVYVNGKQVKDGAEMVKALQIPFSALANHSGPDGKLEVMIVKDNDTARLTVKRDSRTYDEYYVFYNEYKYSRENHIRRLKTKVFDRYSYRVVE